MDIDLRVSRLEREQRQRRDALKRRLEQERRSQERFQLQQKELEDLKALRALEREAEEEQRRLEEEHEMARTAGIRFNRELVPFLTESDEDKVLLPESALVELTNLNAFQFGALTFQLTCSGTNVITHSGVREFSAAEGTIGIPRKILNTLTGNATYDSLPESIGQVQIKFVRLPQITFARLQPLEASFASVSMIKNCLQDNLRLHTTLTVGDILCIWFRGRSYRLRVHELRPENFGSVIDTDVEVELVASEEYEQSQRDAGRETVTPNFPETSLAIQDDHLASIPDVDYILSEEPAGIGENVIECKVKTAEGVTRTRKFLKQTDFKELFYLALEVCGGRATRISVENIQLTTRFPKKVFSFRDVPDGQSFADLGFLNSQELFLVSTVHVNN